jgi:hypothetical protein
MVNVQNTRKKEETAWRSHLPGQPVSSVNAKNHFMDDASFDMICHVSGVV